jgi:hypothetical protein
VEDHRSHLLRNTLRQTIKFMYTIKQQNLSDKARYKYISRFTPRKLTHPELPPNSILTGALIGVRLASPIIPETCSTHKATHENHDWVHVATDATQIRVYDAMAAKAILVNVRDRYVTKLFGRHFCGNKDTIFISHLHVSGPIAMHTFGVILVLLP